MSEWVRGLSAFFSFAVVCASLSVEGVCSMFRTVGKVVSNLGFPNEVCE